MKKLKVTREKIETVSKFKFTAPYVLQDSDVGNVRTELTINYTKKEYHFLDGGRYHLDNSRGHGVVTSFKEGSVLDITFKELFAKAESFAKKELAKIKG